MKVTRTIVETVVHAAKISVNEGQISTEEVPAFSIAGTVEASNKEVMNRLAKLYPNQKMVEISREVKEELRGMELDKFIEMSEIVTRPPSQKKKVKENK